MRRPWYIVALVASVLVAVAPAVHAGVVFEYYERERPVTADGPMHQLLESIEKSTGGGFWALPATLRNKLDAVAPAPGISDVNLTASALMGNINVGYKAYLDARYDQAI